MNSVHKMENQMFAAVRRLVARTNHRTAAQVRGAQILGGIDQKILQSDAALHAAQAAMAGLMHQEKAGLQQAERVMLQHLAAPQMADDTQLQQAQANLARIAARIGVLAGLIAQTRTRRTLLKESAIAARGLRLEHIATCSVVAHLHTHSGPEAADRLMASLPLAHGAGRCFALSGAAANVQRQVV
jgi:hypothetical protein